LQTVSKQGEDKPPQDLASIHKEVANTAPQQPEPLQKANNDVLSESNGLLSFKSSTLDEKQQPPVTPAIVVAAAQKLQQAIPERKSYQELTPTNVESTAIYNMIYTIGSLDTYKLYGKKSQLIEWGKQAALVHPLKFLETVLNRTDLKQAMRDIESGWGGFKWRGFLTGESESPGFVDQCQNADNSENFTPYLPDFCAAVKVDLNKVTPLVKAKKWEEFIRFLIKS
jgi:hypothetical protein